MGKKLAIKGHPTRGNEVIELFKMMGGCECGCCGCGIGLYYYISQFGNIEASCKPTNFDTYIVYTLEEFWEKYPLKVGDKVKDLKTDKIAEVYKMHWSENNSCVYYDIKYPNNHGCQRRFRDLQPYKEEPNMKDSTTLNMSAIDYNNGLVGYEIPEGYEFDVVMDGKIFLKPIKPKYPATYAGCCDVLLIAPFYNLRYHTYEPNYDEYATSNSLLSLQDKLNTLGKLIICYNAYRKIAGEQIGLDGPWEPDWNDHNQPKFGIHNVQNNICTITLHVLKNMILVFPTEEIRDTFYENFKDLIEQCKELL